MNNTVSMLSMKLYVTSHYGYKSKLFSLVMKSIDTSQMKQSKKNETRICSIKCYSSEREFNLKNGNLAMSERAQLPTFIVSIYMYWLFMTLISAPETKCNF